MTLVLSLLRRVKLLSGDQLLLLDQGQVVHGVPGVARHVLLDGEEVRELESVGGEAGVGLEQHEAGVGAGVDVQLVILIIPGEAAPSLLYWNIAFSINLTFRRLNSVELC